MSAACHKLTKRTFAIAGVIAALCAGCAPAPVATPVVSPKPAPQPAPVEAPAPLPEPEFLDGRTYAVVDIESEAFEGLYTLCDVTVLRRYRLRYNRQNWPTCSSRELLIGVSRTQEDQGAIEAELEPGRRFQVWEIVDLATGVQAAPLEGSYALAALTREQDTIEVLTGRTPVYQVAPGRIHYLGRVGPDGAINAYPAKEFSAAFRKRFRSAGKRLVTKPPQAFEVSCEPALGSTQERITGFNCIGKRLRARFF